MFRSYVNLIENIQLDNKTNSEAVGYKEYLLRNHDRAKILPMIGNILLGPAVNIVYRQMNRIISNEII